jgi:MFS family permease
VGGGQVSRWSPAARRGPLAVLRGPFGFLWAGQTVSLLGDAVFLVAFTWQVAVEWGRPALLGGLLGVRILAELAALGLAGWIVDRIPRRTTVLATDAARALVLLGLAAGLEQRGHALLLGVMVAAYGIFTGLFRPALVAYVPQVVGAERLAAANAAIAVSAQTSLVLGPAIGAGLVGLGSAATALRLDAASFLVAACCALPLPGPAPTPGGVGRFAQAVEGFRTARRVPWVGGTILLFSVANLAMITAQRIALPRAAADRYGQLGGYGAVLVAMGVGAVAAALFAGRAAPPSRPGRTAYAGVLLLGLATAAFGLVRGVIAAGLVGLAFGFGQQLFELLWITGLQRNVPGRLLGRVSAVDQFGSFLFLPVSFAFGGLVVQAVRPELVLLVAGAVGGVLAVAGLLSPALHDWHPVPDTLARPGRPGDLRQPRPTGTEGR